MSVAPGLGMCIAQDGTAYNNNAALVAQLQLMSSLGIKNFQVNIPFYEVDAFNPSFKAKLQLACLTALKYGWTEWGYTCNGQTLDSTRLAAMQTAWANLALWAQSVGLNRIILGNEEDLRIDNNTVTQTSLMNAQIASAQAARAAGYPGDIAVKITTNVYAQWKANVANWKNVLTLGVDLYNTTSAFISNCQDIKSFIAANPGVSVYVPEWNTNGGLNDFVDEFAWGADLYRRYQALIAAGIPQFFYFAWSVGGGEANQWSVIPENSANYRDFIQMLARKRRWFVVRGGNNVLIGNARPSMRSFGTCLSFPGNAGQVSLGTANPFSGNFYIAGYVKWSGVNGNYHTIISKRDSYAPDQMMFSASINPTGTFNIDTNVHFVPFTYAFPVGVWKQFIWEHDVVGGAERLYINGELVSTQGIATLGSKTTSLLSIGSEEATPVDFFNGKLDELVIGTPQTTLTTDQARAIYTKSVYPNMWTLLKFDEGSGNTALDSSGNNNNAIISGVSYATDPVRRVRPTVTRPVVASRPSVS